MSMPQCVVKEWKMVNFELGKTNVKVKSSIQPPYERTPRFKPFTAITKGLIFLENIRKKNSKLFNLTTKL